MPLTKKRSNSKENLSSSNHSLQDDSSQSSVSLQYLVPLELPSGHSVIFVENVVSEGCKWVLVFNTSMYGNYLVPEKLVDGLVLTLMVKSNCAVVALPSISVVCKLFKAEKMSRQWSPYNSLCFTHFLSDMLCVTYTIEDTPNTVNVLLMIDVLTRYVLSIFYMCRHQWIDNCDVKKELAKYAAVRTSVEAKRLEQYIYHCCCYVNKTYNVVTVPDSLIPSIYPWDFADVFLPYDHHSETGETKQNG